MLTKLLLLALKEYWKLVNRPMAGEEPLEPGSTLFPLWALLAVVWLTLVVAPMEVVVRPGEVLVLLRCVKSRTI